MRCPKRKPELLSAADLQQNPTQPRRTIHDGNGGVGHDVLVAQQMRPFLAGLLEERLLRFFNCDRRTFIVIRLDAFKSAFRFFRFVWHRFRYYVSFKRRGLYCGVKIVFVLGDSKWQGRPNWRAPMPRLLADKQNFRTCELSLVGS